MKSKKLLYNEAEILRLTAGGDTQAFSQLVDFHSGKVYDFVRRYTPVPEVAEEIVQDIFTQVWLARDGLTQVRNFEAFVFVVSRNYALNALKRYLREKKRAWDWQQYAIAGDPEPEDDFEQKLGLIEKAASQLPYQQHKVWTLSRKEGLKHSEIAEQMGLTTHTVKKYMQLAIASIVKYTEDRIPVLAALLVLEIF